jgi:hypothetical protein
LLHTVDYSAYCEDNFGRYLHHVPTSTGELEHAREEAARDPDRFVEKQVRRATAQYEEIQRLLGDAVLKKWTLDYPARYSSDVRRQVFSGATERTPLGPLAEHRRDLLSIPSAVDDIRSLSGPELVEALARIPVGPDKIVPITCGSCGSCAVLRCVCNKGPGDF